MSESNELLAELLVNLTSEQVAMLSTELRQQLVDWYAL